MPRIVGGSRRRLLVQLMLNGFAQAAVAFAIAWVTRQVLMLTQVPTSAPFPSTMIAVLMTLGLLRYGLRVLERIDAERLGQDYVQKVRLALFRRLGRLPIRMDKQPRFGITMIRLTSDLNSLKNWVSMGVARLSVALISISGSLLTLAYFSPLAALSVAGILLLCVAAGAGLTLPLRSRVRAARRRRGQLAANLGEKIATLPTVTHFGKAQHELRRLRRQSRRLAQAMVRRMQLSWLLRSLPDAAFPLATAALIGIALMNRFEPGELVAALLLLGMITASLRDIAQAWDYRLAYLEGRRRLQVVFELPHLREQKTTQELPASGPLSLAFKEVRIAGVFSGLTVMAEAGSRVLITGPTGAGKSTLLGLAARLFDPQDGRIMLGGRALQELSLESLQRAVQLVAPTLPLLRGTVADNIAYSLVKSECSADQVKYAAALCQLDQSGEQLPAGIQTLIDDKGQNLPSGLRARIALARAIAARPRLLLIDDPAFDYDPQAQAVLQRVLQNSNATVLIVSTPTDDLCGIDCLWEMASGKLNRIDRTRGANIVTLHARPASINDKIRDHDNNLTTKVL